MVVELATFNEGFHLRRNFRDVQAGDVAQLHQRVRADIAAAAGTTGALRIHAPRRLLLTGGFELGRKPALNVIAVHPAHVTEQTALHDVTAEPAGPVAEISMRHAKRNIQRARRVHQFVGLGEIQTQRFFAEHRDARLHRLHRGIEMHEVRRDDEDVIQLLIFGQILVRRDHVVVGGVTFDRIRPVGGFFHRDFGIGK